MNNIYAEADEILRTGNKKAIVSLYLQMQLNFLRAEEAERKLGMAKTEIEKQDNYINQLREALRLMKSWPHEPAFPGVELNVNGSPYQAFLAMTKREFFALEIMKGVLSNPTTEIAAPNKCCDAAINLADMLIDKLEKTNK